MKKSNGVSLPFLSRGGGYLDDAVFDERTSFVEACATGDLRVEGVAECGEKIVDCEEEMEGEREVRRRWKGRER